MREIKFRAYAVESLIDSQWIENGYGVTKIKYTDGTSSVHILTSYGDYQVVEESVGQYTKKGAISMSVQVLKDYVEFSREIGEKPTWEGLKEHKKMFWRN